MYLLVTRILNLICLAVIVGSRLVHAEALLTRLTHAEAALVVNNNAAAVLLMLTAFAKRRAVVIARSQLVEIGGGFPHPGCDEAIRCPPL